MITKDIEDRLLAAARNGVASQLMVDAVITIRIMTLALTLAGTSATDNDDEALMLCTKWLARAGEILEGTLP